MRQLEIIKQIFKGDAGKHRAFFREMFEVLLLEREISIHNNLEMKKPEEERNFIELNSAQQAEIDARIALGKSLNRIICTELGIIPLEDMKPEEVDE